MSRAYSLDAESAKKADGGNYITETGKYVGVLTRAESVTSKQNTEGIELTFRADNGTSADFIQLWTYNAKGEALPSLNTLNALMTCLRVKGIKPVTATVEKYDAVSRSRKPMQATVFPELMNKPVGLLLQKVWRADDTTKYKFEIAGVFEASTELTSSEILDRKTTPEKLARMVSVLHDKHEKPQKGSSQALNHAPVASDAMSELDDDIPF